MTLAEVLHLLAEHTSRPGHNRDVLHAAIDDLDVPAPAAPAPNPAAGKNVPASSEGA